MKKLYNVCCEDSCSFRKSILIFDGKNKMLKFLLYELKNTKLLFFQVKFFLQKRNYLVVKSSHRYTFFVRNFNLFEMKKVLAFILVFIISSATSTAWSWGGEGHDDCRNCGGTPYKKSK